MGLAFCVQAPCGMLFGRAWGARGDSCGFLGCPWGRYGPLGVFLGSLGVLLPLLASSVLALGVLLSALEGLG